MLHVGSAILASERSWAERSPRGPRKSILNEVSDH